MRKIKWAVKFLQSIIFAALSTGVAYGALPLVTTTHTEVSQNTQHYLPNNAQQRLISAEQQKKLHAEFLTQYFKVWNNPVSAQPIVADQREVMSDIRNSKLYQFNFHRVSEKQLDAIDANRNFAELRNLNLNAVVTNNAYLRSLPTEQPLFQSAEIAGQGFPFDTLQVSALWIGTPVKILHFSSDKRWALIRTYNANGWVLMANLGLVDKKFITNFTENPLVAIVKDKALISAGNSYNVIEGRVGMLLPKIKNQVMIPVQNSDHSAELVTAALDKSTYQDFPLALTPENLAKLMQQLLGQPYGWGGFQYYRDCSLSVMDLYLPFGIALPRNSQAQLTENKFYNLNKMNATEKLRLLKTEGKPFLTLLGTGSHIVIYLGNKDGVPYVFQAVWGAHTQSADDESGRAVLGQAAITPLSFGEDIPNVKHTLLDNLNKMTTAA